MELIRCSKCKVELPKKYKKKYHFLWWNTEATKAEDWFWVSSNEFGLHLCLGCMKSFKKWLSTSSR